MATVMRQTRTCYCPKVIVALPIDCRSLPAGGAGGGDGGDAVPARAAVPVRPTGGGSTSAPNDFELTRTLPSYRSQPGNMFNRNSSKSRKNDWILPSK